MFRRLACSIAWRHVRSISSDPVPGVVLDIDGVVIQGKKVLEEGRRAVKKLVDAKQVPFLFLTNGGGVTERKKSIQLSEWLNTPIRESQVVLSHSPLRAFANEYENQVVLLVGPTSVKAVAESYDFSVVGVSYLCRYGLKRAVTTYEYLALNRVLFPFTPVGPLPDPPAGIRRDEPVAAVFIMNDSRDWGVDVQLLCDVIGYELSPTCCCACFFCRSFVVLCFQFSSLLI